MTKLFILLSIFSFSAFSMTCTILGPSATEAGTYDEVLATVENALENEKKSNIVVLKNNGEVIYSYDELEINTSLEDYETVMEDYKNAKAINIYQEDNDKIIITTATIDINRNNTLGGMFKPRSSVYGAVDNVLMLNDIALDISILCYN